MLDINVSSKQSGTLSVIITMLSNSGPFTEMKLIPDSLAMAWNEKTVHHTDMMTQWKGLPLTCGDRVNSVQLGQYHGCWCPSSLRRQDISSHDIDYAE